APAAHLIAPPPHGGPSRGVPPLPVPAVFGQRPRPPTGAHPPPAPAWLAAVVERLHARRPADRFDSAAEVAELLRYNLAHPHQPRPVAQPHPPRRRRRMIAGAVALASLLAGGLMLTSPARWWGNGSGQEGAVPRRATLRGHKGPVWSVAFAPDGRTLATGSDDTTLRLWDAATGKEKAVLSGHRNAVVAVRFT